jgi:hypothetical protein
VVWRYTATESVTWRVLHGLLPPALQLAISTAGFNGDALELCAITTRCGSRQLLALSDDHVSLGQPLNYYVGRAPTRRDNPATMLFWKRYRYFPEGLLKLARDLAAADPRSQRRAHNALRKDRQLRDIVLLLVIAFEVVDEQREAGTFQGDAVALETMRPVARTVARLRELSSISSGRVQAAATTVLELLGDERRDLQRASAP